MQPGRLVPAIFQPLTLLRPVFLRHARILDTVSNGPDTLAIRRLEQAVIGFRVRHGLRTARSDAPLIHDFRSRCVNGWCPRVLNTLELRCIFDGKAVGRHEVTERVVPGSMSAGTPQNVDTVSLQAPDTTHHVIHGEHVVSDVIQTWGPWKNCDAMVP